MTSKYGLLPVGLMTYFFIFAAACAGGSRQPEAPESSTEQSSAGSSDAPEARNSTGPRDLDVNMSFGGDEEESEEAEETEARERRNTPPPTRTYAPTGKREDNEKLTK